jgi:hypothetical protein
MTVTCFEMMCTKKSRRKNLGQPSKKTWLHDNTCQYMANMTQVTLATMGWEITNQPPHSPHLAPTDFHLFGLKKIHLRGQKFQTDDACSIQNWLCSKDNIFYAAGISNLPGWWKKCVSLKEECLEKDWVWWLWQIHSSIKSGSTLNHLHIFKVSPLDNILSCVCGDYIRRVLDWQLDLLDHTQLHTITVYTLLQLTTVHYNTCRVFTLCLH